MASEDRHHTTKFSIGGFFSMIGKLRDALIAAGIILSAIIGIVWAAFGPTIRDAIAKGPEVQLVLKTHDEEYHDATQKAVTSIMRIQAVLLCVNIPPQGLGGYVVPSLTGSPDGDKCYLKDGSEEPLQADRLLAIMLRSNQWRPKAALTTEEVP